MRGATKTSLIPAILLFSACTSASSLPPPRVDPTISIRIGNITLQENYEASLERWTRRAALYDRLDARFFFASTLLTPEFREALAARDASLGLPASPLFAPVSEGAAAVAPSLLLGLYAHDTRLDDFSAKHSIWRITLTTSQGTLLPEEIRRIAKPNHRLRSSFPFLDRFWVAYLITFPDQSGKKLPGVEVTPFPWDEAILNLQSIVGHVSMNFQPFTPRNSARGN